MQGRQESTGSESERDQAERDDRNPFTETATAQSNTVTPTDALATKGDVDADERGVPLDQIFGILSNQRRRRILRILTETDRVSLGDLAEQLAAREHDKPRDRLTSQERKRCYVALYQVHLPKLADVDAISYNKSRGVIKPGPTLHNFTSYLPDDSGSTPSETQARRWTAYIPDILK